MPHRQGWTRCLFPRSWPFSHNLLCFFHIERQNFPSNSKVSLPDINISSESYYNITYFFPAMRAGCFKVGFSTEQKNKTKNTYLSHWINKKNILGLSHFELKEREKKEKEKAESLKTNTNNDNENNVLIFPSRCSFKDTHRCIFVNNHSILVLCYIHPTNNNFLQNNIKPIFLSIDNCSKTSRRPNKCWRM